MTSEEAKGAYLRFVEDVINEGRLDVIEEVFAPDYVDHSAPPGAPPGMDSVQAVAKMFRTAFPDVHFTVESLVSEGDKVASRVIGRGTNNGPFMGAPPTGRQVAWESMGLFRVVDGKIVEHWGVPDLFGLLQQLGVISRPG